MKPKQVTRFEKEMKKGRKYYFQEIDYEWLTPLLDAYQIVDAGIKVLLDSFQRSSTDKVACHKGCYHCCTRYSVPINRFELMGLEWYATEIMEKETRKILQNQLREYAKNLLDCPFTINKCCSIYPVRPIACRILYIKGEPCLINEDVDLNRSIHVHTPELAWEVAQKLLPLFDI